MRVCKGQSLRGKTEMDEPLVKAAGKTVFILEEDFSLESVEDKIVALGHTFQKRALLTNPLDWIEIEKDVKQLSASGDLLAILMFLSEKTLRFTSSSEYLDFWNKILMEIKKCFSLIFIYEDNLHEKFYQEELESKVSKMRYKLNILNENIRNIEISKDDKNRLSIFNKMSKDMYSILDNFAHIQFLMLQNQIDYKEYSGLSDILLKYQNAFLIDIEKLLSYIENSIDSKDALHKKIEIKQLRPEQFIRDIASDIPSVEHYLDQLQRYITKKLSKQSQRAKQLLKTILASGVEI